MIPLPGATPDNTYTLDYRFRGRYSRLVEDQPVPTVSQTFTVTARNLPPEFRDTSPDPGVEVGALYKYKVLALDPENDPLTFEALRIPAGASFDPATRTLNWTPTVTQLGLHPVVLKIHDSAGNETRQEYEVKVVLSAPKGAAEDPSAGEGSGSGPGGLFRVV